MQNIEIFRTSLMPRTVARELKQLPENEGRANVQKKKTETYPPNNAIIVRGQIINLRKVTIYLLTSCNTEERIAQNIYIHNSNKSYKY